MLNLSVLGGWQQWYANSHCIRNLGRFAPSGFTLAFSIALLPLTLRFVLALLRRFALSGFAVLVRILFASLTHVLRSKKKTRKRS